MRINYTDGEITIDANGFGCCLICGGENYGEGSIEHNMVFPLKGLPYFCDSADAIRQLEDYDPSPCCPYHSHDMGSNCDFPGYADNH